MDKKKITFVCKHLANGGAERVMSELITQFDAMGHYVQVILLYDEKDLPKNIEFEIPDTVDLVELNWKADKRVFQAVVHNADLRKVIKGDYIISMLYPATEAAIIAGRITGIPVVVSERNYPKFSPPTKKGRMIRDFSFHFADYIVFQTHEARDYFPRDIRRKGTVIPNPIRQDLPERFTGERQKKIAVVGRLEKQKNHPMMLRTFKEFLKDHPDYELHIYSRGPLLEELQDYARELGIADKVFFEGFVENVNAIINDFAMYVSTSDYEGISNAMLEALAMGMPSICTDCPVGGAGEAIKSGQNGILIPVGDEKALLESMKKIAEDPEFAEAIGKEAAKIKERYRIDKVARRWIKVLDRLHKQ